MASPFLGRGCDVEAGSLGLTVERKERIARGGELACTSMMVPGRDG
jgi:hypothetical protein